MNIVLQRITYKDLRDQTWVSAVDNYGMVTEYLTSSVRSTLLANPNLDDERKSAINIIVCDGIIAGRNMLMPTKLKINDEIIMAQTGGSYEIAEQLRGHGLGTMAFRDSIMNSDYDPYIGQLYSTTAADIVRKLGLIIFELPSYYKLCSSRSVLEAKRLRGFPLKLGTSIIDALLRLVNIPNTFRLKKLKTLYQVKKENIIPIWIDDLTLRDGHAFMEVHDHRWLQWCLDNKFTEEPNDKQSFYSVYDSQGNPKGFFMTKVRFERSQGKYKNIIRGTIVEWGSYNEKELSEIDLNLLAIDSFGSQVDNIITVLSNISDQKSMKKIGFIRHGSYQMSIKPGELNQDGISDQSKWRIRYGGCNTIIF